MMDLAEFRKRRRQLKPEPALSIERKNALPVDEKAQITLRAEALKQVNGLEPLFPVRKRNLMEG